MLTTRTLALGRAALGTGLLARPELLTRLLGVDAVTARRTSWVVRMFAARELALGAGTASAKGQPGGDHWAAFSACADAGDVLALGLALRHRQVSTVPAVLALVTAAGAVGVQLAASRRR